MELPSVFAKPFSHGLRKAIWKYVDVTVYDWKGADLLKPHGTHSPSIHPFFFQIALGSGLSVLEGVSYPISRKMCREKCKWPELEPPQKEFSRRPKNFGGRGPNRLGQFPTHTRTSWQWRIKEFSRMGPSLKGCGLGLTGL
jgi:hypothetical protein